jgi:hypothetical protein
MTDVNEHKYDQPNSTETPEQSKKNPTNPSQQTGTHQDPRHDPKSERDKDAENSRRQERERGQQPEKRSA